MGFLKTFMKPYDALFGDDDKYNPQNIDRDAMYTERQAEWEKHFEPIYDEYTQSMEKSTLESYQQEMARAKMKLGYAQSAGAGTSGVWDAASLALRRQGSSTRMQIKNMAEQAMWKAEATYMAVGDQFAHQEQMAHIQGEYNLMMAELNSPGWWDALGSFAGFGLFFI